VNLGQAHICIPIVWVQLKGFLEKGSCPRSTIGRVPITLTPAFQNGIIGFYIISPLLTYPFFFTSAQLHFQCRDNLSGDLILQSKDLAHRAVISLCPQMAPRHSINKLSINSNFISGLAYTPLKDVSHSKLFSHLLKFHSLSLVGESRIPGNY